MKLVLHTCCAICGIYLADFFRNRSEKTFLYFYNPNIYPPEEYQRRLEATKKMAEIYHLDFLAGEDDSAFWWQQIKGLEKEPEGGKRCEICFQMRLEKTAQLAKTLNYDTFATTLGISPYKKLFLINHLGNKIAQKFGLNFFSLTEENKKNFWSKSRVLAKKFNFYHQKYCGCLFSWQQR
ncbi:MAG: epoxyqueuosine reductase QueH [Patescibacteria group bacterium]|nr:epoxyqueuosine reductase QueH [Patescibacteria group bacterium]